MAEKQYVLSLSYGKDSMACLGAIEKLGWPLDRIVTADIWATEEIQADLPEMVEFKKYADRVILERYGIEVEHFCCNKLYGIEKEKVTYNDIFYREKQKGKYKETGKHIYGFPILRGPWCQKLKTKAIERMICKADAQYIGIAADEPKRFGVLNDTKLSPLVEVGWTELDARNWCEQNGLLSPIYTKTMRGGCWFCHNQGIQQLRMLRKEHPELWEILMQWDLDSPVIFKADGHTVHDMDRRFQLEDEGILIPGDSSFKWSMLDGDIQIRWF